MFVRFSTDLHDDRWGTKQGEGLLWRPKQNIQAVDKQEPFSYSKAGAASILMQNPLEQYGIPNKFTSYLGK
ncbi:hypothetical protein Ancab_037205 [Ancistrocladus abbreviatus]